MNREITGFNTVAAPVVIL